MDCHLNNFQLSYNKNCCKRFKTKLKINFHERSSCDPNLFSPSSRVIIFIELPAKQPIQSITRNEINPKRQAPIQN